MAKVDLKDSFFMVLLKPSVEMLRSLQHPDGDLHGKHVIDSKLQAKAYEAHLDLIVPSGELGVHY